MTIIKGGLVLILFSYRLLMLIIHWKGLKKVDELPFESTENSQGSLVSIIIPAKDEEKAIVPTLRSLINQHYKNIEIIVVNDRSTDNTAAKLENFMEEITEDSLKQKIKILHIQELPSGWLG